MSRILEVTETAPRECEGCPGNWALATREYRVVLDDGEERRVARVAYCDACADLAAVNYSGTVAAIHPDPREVR